SYRAPPDSPRCRNRLRDLSRRTQTPSQRGRDREILARTAYSSRRKRRPNHASFGHYLLTEDELRTRGPELIGRIALWQRIPVNRVCSLNSIYEIANCFE